MTTLSTVLSLLDAESIARVAEAVGAPPRSRPGSAMARLPIEGLDLDDVLEALPVRPLRAICRHFALPSEGLRDDLIERLLDWSEVFEGRDDAANDDELELTSPGPTPLDAVHRGRAHAAQLFATMRALRGTGRPRPYQRDAVGALQRAVRPGGRHVLHVATGGGKTAIANDFAAQWLARDARPVLWVTKDWRLLEQAARDAGRHFDPSRLGRIGGDGTVLHPLSPGNDDACIVYTTLQTFARRHGARALGLRPGLVVWDESHWGEHASSGRRLLKWAARLGAAVLGLTATPRLPQKSAFEVAYSKDFSSLVNEGWLAQPRLLAPVETGVPWTPERVNDHCDFRPDSLRRLGRSQKRNARIVDHYARNRARYGQTIIFACSIEHAELLAGRLGAPPYGIPARALHSSMSAAEQQAALQDFERGQVDVLVNVAMLTHGLDLPAVRTVFLCRPTLSDILFAQMVGRASRLDPSTGKDAFNVVEFTDCLEKFGDQLMTAKHWFHGTPSGEPKAARPVKPRVQRGHHYDPTGTPMWIPDIEGIPEAMRGLWFRRGQTFGVELELTRNDFDGSMTEPIWRETAEPLRQALVERLGAGLVAADVLPEYGSPDKSHLVWNVERDGSCGWEVTTRVLRDGEGMRELIAGCEAIERAARRLGLEVNFRTGLHLHLGWLGRTAVEIRRALELARLFEPALASLVAPSRIAEFNGSDYDPSAPNVYCQPVAKVFPAKALAAARTMDDIHRLCRAHAARFVSFNVKPLRQIHTVEVRLHGGTTDPRKILLWLSLWQQLLWAAQGDLPIESVPDRAVIVPDGDIVALVDRYFPRVEQPRFLERIVTRRAEVHALWRQNPSLAPWLPARRVSGASVPLRRAA